MSGAQNADVGVAQVGRFAAENTDPVEVQVTRSVERAVGISAGVPVPERSGSLVAKAYQAPSSPRTSDGSANVSAKPDETGFTSGGGAAEAGAPNPNTSAAAAVAANQRRKPLTPSARFGRRSRRHLLSVPAAARGTPGGEVHLPVDSADPECRVEHDPRLALGCGHGHLPSSGIVLHRCLQRCKAR